MSRILEGQGPSRPYALVPARALGEELALTLVDGLLEGEDASYDSAAVVGSSYFGRSERDTFGMRRFCSRSRAASYWSSKDWLNSYEYS